MSAVRSSPLGVRQERAPQRAAAGLVVGVLEMQMRSGIARTRCKSARLSRMKPLAALFMIFAYFGLIFALLGHAARLSSPAPSMVTNNASPIGYAIAIICGLIALAAYASH